MNKLMKWLLDKYTGWRMGRIIKNLRREVEEERAEIERLLK